MLKVLLINPPQTYYSKSMDFSTYFPLGLMYLAAVVRNVCDVAIFDCLLSSFEVKKGDATTYGATPEEIRKVIVASEPDIVGISVPFTTQYENAELVARITKEVNPKIITVFGGPDPSVRFKTILENNYCDYCVVGEGEETFCEFIKNFSSASALEITRGLACKRNGYIQYVPRPFNTDLDALPFPAFDLVDMKLYLQNKYLYSDRSNICKNSVSIITSRGCPYSCVFCSIKLHMGQKYRVHSPAYVMKLIHLCIDKYGITNFHFEDDNLSFDKKRFETILDSIIDEKLRIHWDTPNGLRVDTLDYGFLKKMKQSGCVHISLAIESGNQRVLNDVIKKKSKLPKVLEVVKFCRKSKIPANAFYVIGFPGEKLDEMKDTVDLAFKLYDEYGLSPSLLIATPLYGTELYNICIQNGFIKADPTFAELSVATNPLGSSLISTPDFSQKQIQQLVDEYIERLLQLRMQYLLKHPIYLLKWFVNRLVTRNVEVPFKKIVIVFRGLVVK